MKIIDKTSDLLATLQDFAAFEGIEAEALQWLIDQSEYKLYKKGNHLFEPGEPADHMLVMVKGHVLLSIEQNGRRREMAEWETGDVSGVLPFSRMTETRAYGKALQDCYVLALHRNCFTEMVNVSYAMTQSLVAIMSTRIRDFTQMRTQNEKLMALGKLSAGLAHELNNPVSAIVRSSEELYANLHQTPEKFKQVITMKITPEETDLVNEILAKAKAPDLGILEREERVDDIMDWLEDHGIEDGEDIAETFVEFGITHNELQKINEIVVGRNTEPLMWWMQSSLHLERLVTEIRESSCRISDLIKSIKSYSHMDRDASMEALDVRTGLQSTLTILNHKLKDKKIGLVKEWGEEVPKIKAYGGELNQVWTNIIINAVEAMEPEGTLTIKTYQERDHVCVEIQDDGPGIPEEDQSRIFEPFFTTKDINEGTGIGLDIVKRIVDRHHGTIKVRSQAGETVFQICLPTASRLAKATAK